MQESSGLNPDWLGELISFSMKNLNILLKISLSDILPQVGYNDIRQQFSNTCFSFFLWAETKLAFSND